MQSTTRSTTCAPVASRAAVPSGCADDAPTLGAMDLGIKGRLALVTGASRGIGAGIARALAAEGAAVVLVARSEEGLEQVRSSLPQPASHHAIAIDLMEDGAPEQLAEQVLALGDLDIAVQNLG